MVFQLILIIWEGEGVFFNKRLWFTYTNIDRVSYPNFAYRKMIQEIVNTRALSRVNLILVNSKGFFLISQFISILIPTTASQFTWNISFSLVSKGEGITYLV